MESLDNTPNILKNTLFIVNWNEFLELELVGQIESENILTGEVPVQSGWAVNQKR